MKILARFIFFELKSRVFSTQQYGKRLNVLMLNLSYLHKGWTLTICIKQLIVENEVHFPHSEDWRKKKFCFSGTVSFLDFPNATISLICTKQFFKTNECLNLRSYLSFFNFLKFLPRERSNKWTKVAMSVRNATFSSLNHFSPFFPHF